MATRLTAVLIACIALSCASMRVDSGDLTAATTVMGYATPWTRQVDELERKPTVSPQNLRGYGALAIRQGRDLYILDGEASRAKAFRGIERGATVRGMSWSSDGRWLAYAANDALWLVARDGSTPRRLPLAILAGDTFGWSPRADVLWVGVQTPRSRAPESSTLRTTFSTGKTTLLRPDGHVSPLYTIAVPSAVHWSPSGRNILSYAFAGTLPYAAWTTARQALFTERPSPHATLERAVVRVISNPGGQVALAGFVPRSDDILYWHGSEVSASVAADGQELWLQRGPARVARELGYMLEDPEWITFAGDARRFVFVQGSGREAWHTKSLVLCTTANARCSPLPQPPDTISLDPRWSPHGSRIAFVRARDIGPDGGYGHDLGPFLTKWVEQRTLWLQDANGGLGHPLERFGRGIYWPRWSRDGRRLLVYRDGEIWLGASGDTPPKRIVTGLVRPSEFDGGYFLWSHGEVSDDDSPVAWTGG